MPHNGPVAPRAVRAVTRVSIAHAVKIQYHVPKRLCDGFKNQANAVILHRLGIRFRRFFCASQAHVTMCSALFLINP